MTHEKKRVDPADRYYKAAHIAEQASNALFLIAGALSFAVLFIDPKSWTVLFECVEIGFAMSVILLFGIGVGLRLYWTPRAEDQRRLGFFSNSFGVSLTHEKSQGYYNNPEAEPLTRLGLTLMENCFFSRAIALEMLWRDRVIVGVYVVTFLVAAFLRTTDIAVIATATQVVFSEQIVSRWLRLEWLRMRSDAIYQRLYDLYQSPPASEPLRAARSVSGVEAADSIHDRADALQSVDLVAHASGVSLLILYLFAAFIQHEANPARKIGNSHIRQNVRCHKL